MRLHTANVTQGQFKMGFNGNTTEKLSKPPRYFSFWGYLRWAINPAPSRRRGTTWGAMAILPRGWDLQKGPMPPLQTKNWLAPRLSPHTFLSLKHFYETDQSLILIRFESNLIKIRDFSTFPSVFSFSFAKIRQN